MKYAKSKLIKTRMASLAVAQRGRKQAVEDIPVTLLIPMSRLGGGRYALYQRGAGSYFVRTVGPVSQQDLGVSVDAAAKIYEFESRWGLYHLIREKIQAPVRVVGEDGSIYDTRKDKQLYKGSWDYEAVTAHETRGGRLYLRFTDPHETRVMIVSASTKEKLAQLKDLFGEPTNEALMENLAWSIELWCGSDRTFSTLYDKVGDVVDPLLEFDDVITVDNDASLELAQLAENSTNEWK